MKVFLRMLAVPAAIAMMAGTVSADSFFFSTGNPDGKMATASRLSSATRLDSATFTGLLPTGIPLTDVVDVRIEIYRVFPALSDVARTSGPPTFSTERVPTRVNSPSDVEFDDRDTSPPPGNLK